MVLKSLVKSLMPPFVVDLVQQRRMVLRSRNSENATRDTYEKEFVEFIALRRNLVLERAEELVVNAQRQFAGGWGGREYRHFTELALETFKPLYDETSDEELIETYKFHGAVDFLRMLGYLVPNRADLEPIVNRLSRRKVVGIVDYGCGLAPRTIAVSRHLLAKGIKVRLTLVDIRRQHHIQFLDFLCRKHRIDYEFVEVTEERLYPELPDHDYCDNVSVLEHVREPLTVLNNTDRRLNPGGLLLASVEDEIQEMMHITPNLATVRDRLAELRYSQVGCCSGVPLFQKP